MFNLNTMIRHSIHICTNHTHIHTKEKTDSNEIEFSFINSLDIDHLDYKI